MTKKILLSLTTIGLLTSVQAVEFKPVGFKAVGLGGAGVASTRGSLSGYYNPALLRMSDATTEFSLNVGASLSETNLIENIDELESIDFDTTLDSLGKNLEDKRVETSGTINGADLTLSNGDTLTGGGTIAGAIGNGASTTQTINGDSYTISKSSDGTSVTVLKNGTANETAAVDNIKKAIEIITKKLGQGALSVNANPSFAIQASDAVAIGVYANVSLGMKMKFSKDHDKLLFKETNDDGDVIYYEYDYDRDVYVANLESDTQIKNYKDTSLQYATDNDVNSVEVMGSLLTEIPISYAKAYDWAESGYWSFGLNVKPMTFESTQSTIKFGESQDDAEDENDDAETTEYKNAFGLDLGVAFRPQDSDMTVGLMIKNLNGPKFKVDNDPSGLASDVKLDPMTRIGISLPVWNNNIEFALDADLTKNETLLGDESQYIGGGLEFHPASWFALRLGAMQDSASDTFDYGTIMTGGIGIGLKWLQIDLSATQSSEKGSYDGEEIPRYSSFNFSIVSKWGDGYNTKTPPKEEELPATKLLNESEKNKINSDAKEAQKELESSL